MLALITFIPLVGAILTMLTRRDDRRGIEFIGAFASIITLALSISLISGFRGDFSSMQFIIRHDWIDGLGIEFHMGIDGISLWMVLLTAFLTPICIFYSVGTVKNSPREFIAMLLALETSMIGVFVSLDMILFFVFWEAILIPMYFLIGIWGYDRKTYSAMKFLVYTMFGSILMLVAILMIHKAGFSLGIRTFDLLQFPAIVQHAVTPRTAQILFWFFFLAFAIKIPIFPFHTWLPDAHTDAPTAGSVILAGILLKMGAYGFLRLSLPIFPRESLDYALFIIVLGVVGIIYGAWVATMQPDMKRLVAYSSVSHLGLVVLGIFTFTPEGMTGGLLQMVNHGLSTGALFLIVGMLYERAHTKLIEKYGGISRVMPYFSACFLLIMLSSIGLPGLNGFVGEILILLGSAKSSHLVTFPGASYVLTVLAASGAIWSAVYMLWMFQRVMQGPIRHEENKHMEDISAREKWALIPIIVLCILIGIFPKFFTKPMEAPIMQIIDKIHYEKPELNANSALIKNPIAFNVQNGDSPRQQCLVNSYLSTPVLCGNKLLFIHRDSPRFSDYLIWNGNSKLNDVEFSIILANAKKEPD